MNYPFLYKIINQLDAATLRINLSEKESSYCVWNDWVLVEIQSLLIENYVADNFSNLKLFSNKIYISRGKSSNFHIDRFHYHHLLHRILIPLDDHFQYEWIVNDKIVSYQPKLGQVILFNNMIPHRFISNNQQEALSRDVIYFDLIDPAVESYLKFFNGNNSLENGQIDKKYKKLI
ncbi:MAG: hypothetical protein WA160_05445 [Pseudobdellovibrio sp.]